MNEYELAELRARAELKMHADYIRELANEIDLAQQEGEEWTDSYRAMVKQKRRLTTEYYAKQEFFEQVFLKEYRE